MKVFENSGVTILRFGLLCAFVALLGGVARAQTFTPERLQPDARRVMKLRAAHKPTREPNQLRPHAYAPQRQAESLPLRPRRADGKVLSEPNRRTPAQVTTANAQANNAPLVNDSSPSPLLPSLPIQPGTSLGRILHTSQLSLTSAAGSVEQLADRNRDLTSDERTRFDNDGGAFAVAVGRSGTRYEVYSAVSGARRVGVLTTAFDTNGDYVRDSAATYDLERDFGLPSAVAVVSGVSTAGREFVIVSSSGYYNPGDPESESSAGVLLLVRDAATGGFDNSRTRELVRVGSNQLNNANALALMPNGDLLIADFDSNEMRVVRDTDGDRVPDTLRATPFYQYRFSDDAPLAVAVNSRGVVFSHSYGNDAVLLALYDTDGDGFADTDEVAAEGLSLDNNLILHGLTAGRDGTLYVIEDASGAADTTADGGNLGAPQIDAFPDPALNGVLRDGAIFARADNVSTQSLTGLSFGIDNSLPPVATLALGNAANRNVNATRDGLAIISGQGLTRGRSGSNPNAATANGVRVTVEGVAADVLAFNDSRLNLYLPANIGAGVKSVVIYVNDEPTAAEDVRVENASPALFTVNQTGTGAAVALLASGYRFTPAPFERTTNGQPSIVALFGTGFRNALPVTATIGGQTAAVHFAGAVPGFAGMEQINLALPQNLAAGTYPIILTTADGKATRSDVTLTVR